MGLRHRCEDCRRAIDPFEYKKNGGCCDRCYFTEEIPKEIEILDMPEINET